jgi:uncharacterized protein YegP (UPF0339 family)
MSNALGGLLGSALMGYQFSIHKNDKGEFYFIYRNVRGNVEPICWSEGYKTKQSCEDAINKVKAGAANAPIV